ncbi:unnamed protein product, partial [Pylaiella littoralis]
FARVEGSERIEVADTRPRVVSSLQCHEWSTGVWFAVERRKRSRWESKATIFFDVVLCAINDQPHLPLYVRCPVLKKEEVGSKEAEKRSLLLKHGDVRHSWSKSLSFGAFMCVVGVVQLKRRSWSR